MTEIDQVFVKDGERCWFVKLGEIRLFESVGNYAKVFFDGNKPLILKSLNALEERLDERMFLGPIESISLTCVGLTKLNLTLMVDSL